MSIVGGLGKSVGIRMLRKKTTTTENGFFFSYPRLGWKSTLMEMVLESLLLRLTRIEAGDSDACCMSCCGECRRAKETQRQVSKEKCV